MKRLALAALRSRISQRARMWLYRHGWLRPKAYWEPSLVIELPGDLLPGDVVTFRPIWPAEPLPEGMWSDTLRP